MNAPSNIAFSGGFENVPVASSHAFRAAMVAMARPGQVQEISGAQAPGPLSDAAATLLMTLCDPETSIYLAADVDTPELRDWLTFHTGAPFVEAGQADFAVGGWDALMPLHQFKIGTAEYPDRSATLIVERAELSNAGATLRGPGIKDTAQFDLPDVGVLQGNAALFPLGVDFFFTSGTRVAALPRSTQLSMEG